MPAPEAVVDNILAGRTADGVRALGLAIPFSKDPLTRQAAARLLGRVVAGIGKISPDDLTSLAAKLLSHLSKTGLQTVQGIHGFAVPPLVDALREAPEMLSGRAGIAAILRAHMRHSQQAATVLRKRLPPDVPPRRVVWVGAGGYRLEEATDPRHLVHDSVILGHCVGTLSIDAAQERHRRLLAREGPLEQLWYWREIVRGWLRILTLTLDGAPVFTMSFRTATRRIDQIQGKGGGWLPAHPRFPALCEAFFHMPDCLGLREGSMLDTLLPSTEKSWLLTRTGAFTEELTSDSLAQAVAGHIVAGTKGAMVAAAVGTPLISIDMSALPAEVLSGLVESKAALEFHGTDRVSLPNLVQGDVWVTQAESVALPRLVSGAIGADVVSRLDLPMFEDGPVSCPEATDLHAPHFRNGTVYAPKVVVLDLPVHEQGHVDTRAPCVYLPRHRHGDLELNRVRELVAPCHETGAVMAPEAEEVAMPRHRTGQVNAAKAMHLVIPEDVMTWVVVADGCTVVHPDCESERG